MVASGTPAVWLWVFTNQEVTVYTIADNRSHDVVLEILGEAFEGVLASDCFTANDYKDLADWLKQKCVGHLLKNLSDIENQKTRGAVRFARDVTALLREALALKKEKPDLGLTPFSQQAADLEERLGSTPLALLRSFFIFRYYSAFLMPAVETAPTIAKSPFGD